MPTTSRTIVIVGVAVLGTVVAGQDLQLEGLDPASGYTTKQVRTFHELFSLETWQTTTNNDYARFTMQRVSEFFPSAVIPRSGPVRMLESSPRSEIGTVVAPTPPFGRLTLDEFLEKSETDAFIVVHHGQIVYERYPRIQPSGRHIYWSVSKTFAGLLVAQLEAEGAIDVSRPIEVYIPELSETAWRGTPVIDILDQASGMDALEEVENAWERPELAVFQFESSLGLLKWTPAAEESTYDVVAAIQRLASARPAI